MELLIGLDNSGQDVHIFKGFMDVLSNWLAMGVLHLYQCGFVGGH